jgi:hypothetical protein
LQFAYSNLGAINETTAKTQAVPVPLGLMFGYLPGIAAGWERARCLLRRSMWATPLQRLRLICSFMDLSGPVGDVGAGTYTGMINIHC